MMRHLFLLLIFGAAPLQAQEWHGITPLQSNRSDVERIVGRSVTNTANTSLYIFHGEKVFVVYSKGFCNADPNGWNVSQDTVINFTITPNPKPKFSILELSRRGYKAKQDYEVRYITYYSNEVEGISYEVDTQKGMIKSITYLPKLKYNYLRCSGSGESIENTFKVDEYSDIPFDVEKKRLNNFANSLRKYDSAAAYIIVYAGRSESSGEARERAGRIKYYLVNILEFDARRIKMIDGGYREKPSIELFLVPPGASPPLATPTIDPEEVRVIKQKL